ncbi:unnamed protein product, partial [Porites lobata]
AKCKRSLQVLREHAKNSTCPYGLQYRLRPHIPVVQFDREFQTNLDQNGRLANAELLMLKIKQQKKNLHVHVTANNEAIQAQQQLLQDLYPHLSAEFLGNQKLCCQQKGLESKGHEKNNHKVQQICNLASMQAQLSELQKMFCKDSEAVN